GPRSTSDDLYYRRRNACRLTAFRSSEDRGHTRGTRGEIAVTTVSSGQTLDISAGQTSSGIIVLGGGFLDVLSGGTVINSVDSGTMNIESGGTASNISAFGALTVSSGGIVDDVTVSSGGTLFDFGAASGTTVNSGGMEVVASGGVAGFGVA